MILLRSLYQAAICLLCEVSIIGVNILVPDPFLISLSPLPHPDGHQVHEGSSRITLTRRPVHEPNCLFVTTGY